MELTQLTYQGFPCIGYGSESTLYRVDEHLVAKVPLPHCPIENLDHEFSLGNLLCEAGISAPRMEGIFEMIFSSGRKPALVMQYVPGSKVSDLTNPNLKAHAIALLKAERSKAIDYGFFMKDVGFDNGIYLPREDKVVLVDFISWQKEGHDCPGCPRERIK